MFSIGDCAHRGEEVHLPSSLDTQNLRDRSLTVVQVLRRRDDISYIRPQLAQQVLSINEI